MQKNISVVIPTYNGRPLLVKHWPDVIKQLEAGDEVVVVDDASTDDTLSWLETQRAALESHHIALQVVALPHNQRFARAANAGVNAAQHNYVWLLNNDVSPLTPDSKSRLVAWFADPLLFAVGCAEVTTNKPDAPVSGRGTGGWQRGFLAHWSDPDQNHPTTLWTAGGSMMVDRTKFLQIGGFDSIFYPAYEEDRDLSYRALKHGWRVRFAYAVRVWHQHETTNTSVFGPQEMVINSWKNQFLLVWKNITDGDLCLSHLMWWPYHLTVTNWRTGGLLGRGWWRALRQVLPLWRQRQKVKALWTKSDHDVLRDWLLE